ncbi:peptidylprolyl isomerase [Aurantibacter crassamenti]|uniref:peptidylprolyl isomerase n=1 Tax=Aurantibacter crassamenti TaxID=1837375 RepID=UPI0019394E91|nr:peptidylprolyl isomerase [Aurantibacter crassamenti]MBM1106686.1 peptidylprolyl isomerase [Aurantibacter crassamenti]
MKKTSLLIALVAVLFSSCKSQYSDLGDGLFANIQTDKGDMIVKLEKDLTPVTVANFVTLAEGTSPFVSENFKGKKYYDGVTFHRVMKDFMIQGGDPTATGTGNPGYKFADELTDSLHHDKAGILSMANSGFQTNGSQFFITHKATPHLDGYANGFLKQCKNPRVSCHTVFGEVVEGMDVLDSIANVKVAPGDKPIDPVAMKTVTIIRNGKEAKNFDAVEVMTQYFADEEAKIAALNKMKAEFATEMAEQKTKAEELPSGLKILKLKEGTEEKPKIGQKVLIYYAGYLPDGSLFDSNYADVAQKYGIFDENNPYSPMPLVCSPDAGVIAGFKEAMLSMKIGDKVRVFIPPHLGYGAQGLGQVIPPSSDLIFDLEISGLAQAPNN